jgi:hypothetical protein
MSALILLDIDPKWNARFAIDSGVQVPIKRSCPRTRWDYVDCTNHCR